MFFNFFVQATGAERQPISLADLQRGLEAARLFAGLIDEEEEGAHVTEV